MPKKESRKLTKDQAVKKIETLKKDLFNLRFRKINNQVENPAKFNTTKKEIARLFTIVNKQAKWQRKY